jgi:hypothetical protein
MAFPTGNAITYNNRNFYANFPKSKSKPMMIPETSSPYIHVVKNGNATNLEIKRNWWRQILSDETMNSFPLIKAVVWFEETKSDGAEIRDWQITNGIYFN